MNVKKMVDHDLFKSVTDSILSEITNYYWNKYSWLNPVTDSLKDQEVSIDKVITKSKSIKIGNRVIYPVIMFSTIEFNDKFTYESITPFALAVIEGDQRYFIPLDEENEKIKELLSEDLLWKDLGLELDKK